ncbi:MAG: TetR/AcrR family transcriptional regulator [Caulobacteraceae bacterium]
MLEATPLPPSAGQRGPADHAIREQIVKAASDHFRHYGYAKTTVADLAKAIGFSKAYIYKFFQSKQAIGEAIAVDCIGAIIGAAKVEVDQASSATEKLRRLFRTLTAKSLELLFEDNKLYDLVTCSVAERWTVDQNYKDGITSVLQQIILEGRESGEFERKTPIDETCRAIVLAMQPFIHPVALEFNLENLSDASTELTNLILRSLAP